MVDPSFTGSLMYHSRERTEHRRIHANAQGRLQILLDYIDVETEVEWRNRLHDLRHRTLCIACFEQAMIEYHEAMIAFWVQVFIGPGCDLPIRPHRAQYGL